MKIYKVEVNSYSPTYTQMSMSVLISPAVITPTIQTLKFFITKEKANAYVKQIEDAQKILGSHSSCVVRVEELDAE